MDLAKNNNSEISKGSPGLLPELSCWKSHGLYFCERPAKRPNCGPVNLWTIRTDQLRSQRNRAETGERGLLATTVRSGFYARNVH